MLFTIPVFHAIPVQSPVYFISQYVILHVGSVLTKTRVICCIFSSVFCVCKTSSSHVIPHCMCVCFPVVRRDVFKELHLTETGTQSTKVPVVRFVCVPGKFTL